MRRRLFEFSEPPRRSTTSALVGQSKRLRAEARSQGGWVVTSLQIFSDGVDHMTIWLVDAQGTASMLACSPGAADRSWIEKGVAVTADAVYVPAENLSASTWEIDRIAR